MKCLEVFEYVIETSLRASVKCLSTKSRKIRDVESQTAISAQAL